MPNKASFDCAATNERRFIRLGWLIFLGGLGSFLLWATVAPLDKGIISPGTVMVAGYRKVIQSPVNGVVAQIAVKEGQQVHKGDTLVLLSQTPILAQLNAARQRYITALIVERRLQAELADDDAITPPVLAENKNAAGELQTVLHQQNQLMQARQQALKKELDGDAQAIAGLTRQHATLIQASHTKEAGLTLLKRQLKELQPLMAEGYYPRHRYLEIQQQAASLSGDISETQSRAAQTANLIAQTQRNIQQRLTDNRKDIETQLEQVRQQLSESKKQLTLADFDLFQTRIAAPQDGVIMSLALNNPGTVVNPGEQLMELVPQTTALIVEAHLDVAMIDLVSEGLPVTLMFTAFNYQKTPKVRGSVMLISPDRQTDPATRQPYYKIQIAVSPEGRQQLKKEEIKPGMPVDVFIKTGERSLMNYLLKPMMDRASQSFIEE